VLPADQRAEVEAHVAWCAGCRKESAELGAGAATLAFTLPQAAPPEHVEEVVVDSIHASATAPAGRRRGRTAAAAAVAAMIAVSALGWGAVMAGRAERFEVRAERETAARQQAIEEFEDLIAGRGGLLRPAPDDVTRLGQLSPVGTFGGGFALQLVSPDWIDFTLIHVSGLPTDPARAPYRIYLWSEAGERLRAGRIDAVDKVDGTGEAFKEFVTSDLTPFTKVEVRDSAGELVLRGTIDTES